MSRPDDPVTIRFLIEDETYAATVRRGQIIHEAFHLALPEKYTAGCRLTFSSVAGNVIFADNFAGQIEDHFHINRHRHQRNTDHWYVRELDHCQLRSPGNLRRRSY